MSVKFATRFQSQCH